MATVCQNHVLPSAGLVLVSVAVPQLGRALAVGLVGCAGSGKADAAALTSPPQQPVVVFLERRYQVTGVVEVTVTLLLLLAVLVPILADCQYQRVLAGGVPVAESTVPASAHWVAPTVMALGAAGAGVIDTVVGVAGPQHPAGVRERR